MAGAPTVMLAVGLATAVGVYSTPDRPGLGFLMFWLVGVAVEAWWLNFRMPQRIQVSDAGLRFVARTRIVEIPWSGLRSVSSPWHDIGNQSLVWRWEGGRKVRTWSAFVGMHRLLRIVEERAPNAKVWI